MSIDDITDPKRNNFGLVRLLAALCVLISHTPLLITGRLDAQVLTGVSFYNLGDHAVNVFFVISGLLISASLARKRSLVEFTVARTLRIFPALIVCTLVAALILGPIITTLPFAHYASDPHVLDFVALTASAASGSATLPGVFTGNPASAFVISPVWSLKYEIGCYIFLALLTVTSVLATSQRFALLMIGSWLVSAIILVTHAHAAGTTFDNALRLWLAFSIGMALYRFHDHVPISVGLVVCALSAWVIIIGTPLERAVSPFLTGYVALWFAMLPIGRLRSLTNKVDLSYGIYIFGWPVGQTLVWAWPHLPLWWHLPISILVTIAAAGLSWFFVEKPMMSARHRMNLWLRHFALRWRYARP